ncbi:MAG: S1 RNA-binding domain-containing protein, partial [Cyanobacteria bacterium P01_A01_bin.83]
GMVIGPSGKTIKAITEQTGAKIDIEDDGKVIIAAVEADKADMARKMVYNITRKLNEGDVYLGKVTRIIDIGAFVEILPGKEGMIHISQLAEGRVGKVDDEVAVGDEIVVKIRGFDQKNRLNLTRLGIHPDEAAEARAAAM